MPSEHLTEIVGDMVASTLWPFSCHVRPVQSIRPHKTVPINLPLPVLAGGQRAMTAFNDPGRHGVTPSWLYWSAKVQRFCNFRSVCVASHGLLRQPAPEVDLQR